MTISKQAILDAFQFRHACKEFDTERRISAEDFETILESARLSPCSFGLEPWKFLIVQNPALREKLRTHCWGAQKQLPTASHVVLCLQRTATDMRYDSAYVRRFMLEIQQFPADVIELRGKFLENFQREDFNLLDSERHLLDWSGKQTYIPLANMMTVAALLGIDSCPIEGYSQIGLAQVLAEDFGVEAQAWRPVYLLCLGYRKLPPARPKTRQDMATISLWFD
jgi:nitroreductase